MVRALRPLRDGECDLFMGLPTDERFANGTPWVTVSRPYYVMSYALVARADSDIRTLSDLAAQRVAIEAASMADLYLLGKDVQRGLYKCSGLQTVARGLANKRSFRLTSPVNKLKVKLTITANEPRLGSCALLVKAARKPL